MLTGVQLRLDGDEMTLSASDRYRYAVRRLGWRAEAAAPGPVEALVPARRLLEVARSLARCGQVRVCLDATAAGGPIGFEGGPMRTLLRRLDGRLSAYGTLFDMAGRRSPRWRAGR